MNLFWVPKPSSLDYVSNSRLQRLSPTQASSPSHYELINKAYVTEEEIRERPDEVYEAEEDYRGRNEGELTFLRGAIIRNVEQDPDHVGW